jgi:hypothetical protein
MLGPINIRIKVILMLKEEIDPGKKRRIKIQIQKI